VHTIKRPLAAHAVRGPLEFYFRTPRLGSLRAFSTGNGAQAAAAAAAAARQHRHDLHKPPVLESQATPSCRCRVPGRPGWWTWRAGGSCQWPTCEPSAESARAPCASRPAGSHCHQLHASLAWPGGYALRCMEAGAPQMQPPASCGSDLPCVCVCVCVCTHVRAHACAFLGRSWVATRLDNTNATHPAPALNGH